MLKDKTILIGKEPGDGRLLIAVKCGGGVKTAAIGTAGCVPNSVSRCRPAEEVGHCQISIDRDSVMTLTNLKPQNVTFVNDTEIFSKRITVDSKVALGKDRYPVNLHTVIETAKRLIEVQQRQTPVEVSIRHLKAVWEEYDAAILNLQIKQQNQAKRQKWQGFLSMSAMVAIALPSAFSELEISNEIQLLRVGALLFSLGLCAHSVYSAKLKDSFPLKKRELDYRFMDEYVCPNKDCGHYMGMQPYKILSQNKKCPYCGCKYSAK